MRRDEEGLNQISRTAPAHFSWSWLLIEGVQGVSRTLVGGYTGGPVV